VKLNGNWRDIIKKAWSVRFIALAGFLSGLEAILPFFHRSFPPGVFAGLSFFAVAGAFVARIVAQKDLP
jgi:hypothetical protein